MRRPTKIRSELATTIRLDPGNEAAITGLRTEYKAARAEQYIEQLVSTAPALTRDQLARLAGLLTPAAEDELAGRRRRLTA